MFYDLFQALTYKEASVFQKQACSYLNPNILPSSFIFNLNKPSKS